MGFLKSLDVIKEQIKDELYMIISASRRTDVPAFYGEWFINRIREGYFYRVNPFNPKQVKKISLLLEDVDVIVFWTKNPKNMMRNLEILDQLRFKYYFQYTLNDYPKIFEPNLPSLEERIDTFIQLSHRMGRSKVVWRYDPIIISEITPTEYHIERFEKISSQLKGYTERVVISFLDMYAKLNSKFKKIQHENNFKIYDIALPSYRERLINFAKELKGIADNANLDVFTCSEKVDLREYGINHRSCIDTDLINRIFNMNIKYKKDKNQREGCLCNESVDVGMYNSCLHECSYCYANLSHKAVIANFGKHDMYSGILIGSYDGSVVEDEKAKVENDEGEQLKIPGL